MSNRSWKRSPWFIQIFWGFFIPGVRVPLIFVNGVNLLMFGLVIFLDNLWVAVAVLFATHALSASFSVVQDEKFIRNGFFLVNIFPTLLLAGIISDRLTGAWWAVFAMVVVPLFLGVSIIVASIVPRLLYEKAAYFAAKRRNKRRSPDPELPQELQMKPPTKE